MLLPSLSKDSFNTHVLQETKLPVFVLFTAPWDVNSHPTASFLFSLFPQHILSAYSVNFDTERELVSTYSIRQLPIVMVFYKGELIHTCRTVDNSDVMEAIMVKIK